MSVVILDTQPPAVSRCPNSFQVFLDIGQVTKKTMTFLMRNLQQSIINITNELTTVLHTPQQLDNVGVTSVMASQLPGQHLGLGRKAGHDFLPENIRRQGFCLVKETVFPNIGLFRLYCIK
jgi:hypothetical protein